jgi:filamentous hemagglutinin family protein
VIFRSAARSLALVVQACLWLVAGTPLVALAAPIALPQGPTIAGATTPPGASFDTSVANTLNVNQSASRVVIDWQSFNIGAGGTVNFNQASPAWIAFNRVMVDPMTGVSPLSTISGALNAQGGVWLFSTGGILFGPTAMVNVGAFAGVTGPLGNSNDIGQLLNPDGAGVTTVAIGAPIAAGVENITVQNGAQINAASGYVVLQAETMVQDGAITAFDGIDYQVAETGQIQFTTSASGQQLLDANASVVAGQDRPSFSQSGSASAAWVGIDTPGGALQAGYHGLINLGGEVLATGVKPDGQSNGVVLLIGGNLGPAAPGFTGSSIGLDASGATITAANGMFVSTDSATLGRLTLGGSLDVETYSDITLAAPVSVGADVQLNSVVGALAINADLTADQGVNAADQTIAVGPGVIVRSDALGGQNGGVVLNASGNVTADPTSLLIAGVDPAAPTDDVTVIAGTGPQGGDISLGSVSGRNLFIHAQSQGVPGEGALTLGGNVVGTQSVLTFIDDVATQNNPTGALQILGNVSSAGLIDIENLGGGALVVGPGAVVRSSAGQVFLTDGGNTSVDAGARISGVSVFDHTLGLLTIAAGASVATTGTSPDPTAPLIPSGGEFQRASGLNLAAGAVDIQGSVTAGTPTAPDDIYIEALAASGPVMIGGAGGASAFDLSNAQFGHFTARNVIFMGGPGEGQGPGADILVGDLTVDSANISSLWLGTDSSHSITIAGTIAPAGAGPVNVQVGFARQGASPSAGLDGFIPGEIDITGALGSSTAPLGGVDLISRGDILIGAPAFVAAAQADSTFDAVQQSSAFPVAADQVFVASAILQASAQGRLIQQNSAPTLLTFAGLDIGAPSASAPLIAAPASLQGQSIGGGAWTADFAAGPTQIDLFGQFRLPGGGVINGLNAALQPDLVAPPIAVRASYRINSCAFGQDCTPPTIAIQFQPPPDLSQVTQVDQTSVQGSAFSGAVGVLPIDVVSTLTPTAIQQDDDRLGSANPLTETGNGDLWSGGDASCGPSTNPPTVCP